MKTNSFKFIPKFFYWLKFRLLFILKLVFLIQKKEQKSTLKILLISNDLILFYKVKYLNSYIAFKKIHNLLNKKLLEIYIYYNI